MASERDAALRLDGLEDRLRRTRRWLAVTAVALLANVVALVELYREHRDLGDHGLRTTSVQIRDPAGEALASMGRQHPDGRPYFKMLDAQGHYRAFLALRPEGPCLELRDDGGHVRLRLAAGRDGGSVEILEPDGRVVWSAP